MNSENTDNDNKDNDNNKYKRDSYAQSLASDQDQNNKNNNFDDLGSRLDSQIKYYTHPQSKTLSYTLPINQHSIEQLNLRIQNNTLNENLFSDACVGRDDTSFGKGRVGFEFIGKNQHDLLGQQVEWLTPAEKQTRLKNITQQAQSLEITDQNQDTNLKLKILKALPSAPGDQVLQIATSIGCKVALAGGSKKDLTSNLLTEIDQTAKIYIDPHANTAYITITQLTHFATQDDNKVLLVAVTRQHFELTDIGQSPQLKLVSFQTDSELLQVLAGADNDNIDTMRQQKLREIALMTGWRCCDHGLLQANRGCIQDDIKKADKNIIENQNQIQLECQHQEIKQEAPIDKTLNVIINPTLLHQCTISDGVQNGNRFPFQYANNPADLLNSIVRRKQPDDDSGNYNQPLAGSQQGDRIDNKIQNDDCQVVEQQPEYILKIDRPENLEANFRNYIRTLYIDQNFTDDQCDQILKFLLVNGDDRPDSPGSVTMQQFENNFYKYFGTHLIKPQLKPQQDQQQQYVEKKNNLAKPIIYFDNGRLQVYPTLQKQVTYCPNLSNDQEINWDITITETLALDLHSLKVSVIKSEISNPILNYLNYICTNNKNNRYRAQINFFKYIFNNNYIKYFFYLNSTHSALIAVFIENLDYLLNYYAHQQKYRNILISAFIILILLATVVALWQVLLASVIIASSTVVVFLVIKLLIISCAILSGAFFEYRLYEKIHKNHLEYKIDKTDHKNQAIIFITLILLLLLLTILMFSQPLVAIIGSATVLLIVKLTIELLLILIILSASLRVIYQTNHEQWSHEQFTYFKAAIILLAIIVLTAVITLILIYFTPVFSIGLASIMAIKITAESVLAVISASALGTVALFRRKSFQLPEQNINNIDNNIDININQFFKQHVFEIKNSVINPINLNL